METTSSESKEKLKRSGKGLVTALDFNTKVRSPNYKNERCAIGNVSGKELSEIIKEFEKIWKPPYEKKKPKHEPTPRYFHPVRQLAKCIMIRFKMDEDPLQRRIYFLTFIDLLDMIFCSI